MQQRTYKQKGKKAQRWLKVFLMHKMAKDFAYNEIRIYNELLQISKKKINKVIGKMVRLFVVRRSWKR
jgi:hypothetical protein